MSHHELLRNLVRAHITLSVVVRLAFMASQTVFAEVSGEEPESDPVAADLGKARETVVNLEAAKQEMRALYESVDGLAEEGFDLKRLEILDVLDGMGKT